TEVFIGGDRVWAIGKMPPKPNNTKVRQAGKGCGPKGGKATKPPKSGRLRRFLYDLVPCSWQDRLVSRGASTGCGHLSRRAGSVPPGVQWGRPAAVEGAPCARGGCLAQG